MSQEYTLAEVCGLLRASPSWVHLALTKLQIVLNKNGARLIFDEQHVQILSDVMVLRACEISWRDIRKLFDRHPGVEQHDVSKIILRVEKGVAGLRDSMLKFSMTRFYQVNKRGGCDK